MSLSIAEMNDLAFEKARLAYGERRASRLLWVKTNMHELAEKLSDDDVNQLVEKMIAYNKRWWPARAFIRLFTGISKQRELLMYRLVNNLVTTLTQSADPIATLREKQPLLNQITQVGQRAPRFAWFRKTLATWQTWVADKLNLNQAPRPPINSVDSPEPAEQPVEQPIVLDTPEAISRFRAQAEKDVISIRDAYFAARENLILNNRTDAKRRDVFDTCFSGFRKILREVQLKYHPDKTEVNKNKTKEHGLSPSFFKVEADAAYAMISPIWKNFKEKSNILHDCMHKGAEQDAQLADIAARVEELCNPNSESNKKMASMLKAYIEHREQYSAQVKNLERRVNAAIVEQKEEQEHRNQEIAEKLGVVDTQLAFIISALAKQDAAASQADPVVSVHPSTLFAQNNVHSREASTEENDNVELEKQTLTPNI
ncbi:MAG TPA: hypothetical protein VFU82_06260 [Gammaproteobacteria bacterium]|nr:hypothetical protein [Gammaproteobacteria bacterium]